MESLIIEFQKQISDKNNTVSDLVRSCLIIATKLKNDNVKQWLNCELYGYKDNDSVPEYRKVPMEVKFFNSVYGWCPIVITNQEFLKILNEIPLRQQISELYELSKNEKNGLIYFDAPSKVKCDLLAEIPFESDINYVCNSIYISGIIDSVKSKMLEWILTLEENDIIDKEYIFSKEQIQKSQEVSTMIINNFYGDKNKIELEQEINKDGE